MGLFSGSNGERHDHAELLLRERTEEIREGEIEKEIDRVTQELSQLRQRLHQMEQQLNQATTMLSNPQLQSQWPALEQQKAKLLEEMEKVSGQEMKDALKFYEKLEKLHVIIKSEMKERRKAA